METGKCKGGIVMPTGLGEKKEDWNCMVCKKRTDESEWKGWVRVEKILERKQRIRSQLLQAAREPDGARAAAREEKDDLEEVQAIKSMSDDDFEAAQNRIGHASGLHRSHALMPNSFFHRMTLADFTEEKKTRE